MPKWEPIETIPKDGTPVLLLASDGRRGVGFLDPREYDGIKFLSTGAAWIGAVRGERIGVVLGGLEPQEATHWMKLPEPTE